MPKIKYIQPVSAVATSQYSADFTPIMSFDPATLLTGPWENTQWLTLNGTIVNVKLNAAYSEPKILKRLVINNAFASHVGGGMAVDCGVKDVVLYGTNVEAAYLNTVYANLDDLTELHSFQLRQHVASDVADPEEIALPTITQVFKYYIFRCANGWGTSLYMGIRQIDMYFEDTAGIIYQKNNGHWDESLESYVKEPGGVRYVMPTGATGTPGALVDHEFENAVDPSTSLIGGEIHTSWLIATKPLRLGVAYTEAKLLQRLVINNGHSAGAYTTRGWKNVIIYGTNVEAAYLSTDYANLDDLTELHSFQLRQHVASDVDDPQEIALPVITQAFKYYVFRVADHWGDVSFSVVRQIDMYFEKEPWQPSQQNYIKLGGVWQ